MKAGKLPGRTVNALRNAGIEHPEKESLERLLRVPELGVGGVTALAQRIYGKPYRGGVLNWPELER